MLVVVLAACAGNGTAETDAAGETGDTAAEFVPAYTEGGAPADLETFEAVFVEAATAACEAQGGDPYPEDGCYPSTFDGCENYVRAVVWPRVVSDPCDYSDGLSCLNDLRDGGWCPSDGTGWTPWFDGYGHSSCSPEYVCGA